MAYENLGEGALNYFPCRYGNSKLLFRGPRKALDGAYVAMIGGTETYGKFVEQPFPALVERDLDMSVANLGCVNAGPDVFINDQTVMDICNRARATVIQVSGAHNMSNRFYAVHPRRNDRFLRASTLLKTIYREVDFTDFNFTRHLLGTLEEVSPEKFAMVRQELKDAWVARMKTMLTKIGSKVVLVWMSRHSPDDMRQTACLGGDPLFVDRNMLDQIRPMVKDIIEVTATEDEVDAGYDRMVFPEMDAPTAREMLGPVIHGRVANELVERLRPLV
ncbi:DUF6473 family protein [Aliiroseovarius sp. PTFE2010]|uniref:DUF6473 family protein n=1 Tax=Aliiroseovarius sp. PTFE2010 TaxID=3417190 RepID=UPI003CE88913